MNTEKDPREFANEQVAERRQIAKKVCHAATVMLSHGCEIPGIVVVEALLNEAIIGLESGLRMASEGKKIGGVYELRQISDRLQEAKMILNTLHAQGIDKTVETIRERSEGNDE